MGSVIITILRKIKKQYKEISFTQQTHTIDMIFKRKREKQEMNKREEREDAFIYYFVCFENFNYEEITILFLLFFILSLECTLDDHRTIFFNVKSSEKILL